MIVVAGEWWGTAQEVSDHIGHGVTEDMVRWWGRNDGLARVRMVDGQGRPQVRYLVSQAVRIEVAKTARQRGRKRVA